jgi:hypothetical protein
MDILYGPRVCDDATSLLLLLELINSMEQNPSSEANTHSAAKKPPFYGNHTNYRVHESLPTNTSGQVKSSEQPQKPMSPISALILSSLLY